MSLTFYMVIRTKHVSKFNKNLKPLCQQLLRARAVYFTKHSNMTPFVPSIDKVNYVLTRYAEQSFCSPTLHTLRLLNLVAEIIRAGVSKVQKLGTEVACREWLIRAGVSKVHKLGTEVTCRGMAY